MTAAHVPIAEFLDGDEVVAGEHLADDLAFWFTHFVISFGVEDEAAEEYGVDADAYEAMIARLGDTDEPGIALRVPFDGGHTAYVLWQNWEDESTVDYLVHHPGWGRLGFLAQDGPHGSGPGLAWPELVKLAGSAQDGVEGLDDPARRLLLLLPALGDADIPAEARDVVAHALAEVGFRADVVDELAAHLLGETGRAGRPTWSVREGSPIPVCSSDHSPRQVPLALGITAEQTDALAAALGW
ncbi:hypothetical protein PUR71_08300 [Streptomyces sp. SP17BM10]|uniref:hypothetical protein n=1 Tax=Streptomyces sp. SP17BM10 TaxID=3002530 RepID=UPI002E765AE8|nr:hypothetical protein [Streptomyces sp. SP17BM10]MEE1782916.1 hypothetical protein [Streptomyces sp. SP17BM10]